MVATLELRDSFGELVMDGCWGQTPRLSHPLSFFFVAKHLFLSNLIPMKVEPVESLGFTKWVDGQLHQLVVAQIQRSEGRRNWPAQEILEVCNMDKRRNSSSKWCNHYSLEEIVVDDPDLVVHEPEGLNGARLDPPHLHHQNQIKNKSDRKSKFNPARF